MAANKGDSALVVVVVDVQENLGHSDYVRGIVSSINTLVDAFRESPQDSTVVFMRLQRPSYSDLHSELHRPERGDFLIDRYDCETAGEKKVWDALERRGVSGILLSGFFTDLCVRKIALSGAKAGFGMHVIGDCCGSGSAEQDEWALNFLKEEEINVVKTEDLVLSGTLRGAGLHAA